MFRYFLLAVIAYTTIESVQADGASYTYSFKLPQLSADLVLKMKDRLKFKILETAKTMEEESKYMKALYVYAFSAQADQAIGGLCATEEDVEKLDSYTDIFKTSFVTCFDELNCTASFDNVVNEVLVEIQTIDQNTKTAVDACSDENCKTEAYKSLRNSLNELYILKVPSLRLEEDEVKAKGISGIVKCIIPKVEDSYQTMVKDTAKIQTCLALGHSDNKKSAGETEASDDNTKTSESEDTDSDNTNSETETETDKDETK